MSTQLTIARLHAVRDMIRSQPEARWAGLWETAFAIAWGYMGERWEEDVIGRLRERVKEEG